MRELIRAADKNVVEEWKRRGFDDVELEVLRMVPEPTGFVSRFLLGTGLRWAEACRATRADLRGVLLEVGDTKSGRLRRVPLSRELLAEIELRGERIVPTRHSAPSSFSRGIRRWTGIEDFHVHRCRHLHAMRRLVRGTSRLDEPPRSGVRGAAL